MLDQTLELKLKCMVLLMRVFGHGAMTVALPLSFFLGEGGKAL